MASENNYQQKDCANTCSFYKCRCLAKWSGDDDFDFCHWVVEKEADIHNVSTEKHLELFLFTACCGAHNYIYTAYLSYERAFLKRKTVEA